MGCSVISRIGRGYARDDRRRPRPITARRSTCRRPTFRCAPSCPSASPRASAGGPSTTRTASGWRGIARRAARRGSCTTGRRMPTATCTWATSSTASSKTRSSRSRLLDGKWADFVPGWDMHGLPIERETLEHLGVDFHTIDPIELREQCKERALYWLDRQRDGDAAHGPVRSLRTALHDDRPGVRGDDRRRAGGSRRDAASSTRACGRRCGASTTRRRWPKPRSNTRIAPRRRSTCASARTTRNAPICCARFGARRRRQRRCRS